GVRGVALPRPRDDREREREPAAAALRGDRGGRACLRAAARRRAAAGGLGWPGAAPRRGCARDRARALCGAVGVLVGRLGGHGLGVLLLRAVRGAVPAAARRAVA